VSPTELDSWLDQLQDVTGAKVIVIYDACYSGTFLKPLAASNEQRRILMTSTGENELANFSGGGNFSFSSVFWKNTFMGKNIADSFKDSRNSMRSQTNQSQQALLDDNGDGIFDSHQDYALSEITYIGNPAVTAAALPEVTMQTLPQVINAGESVTVHVQVDKSNTQIDKVWGVMHSPSGDSRGSIAITDLPEFTLSYDATLQTYQATIDGFNLNGVYQLSVYASSAGNSDLTSLPATVKIAVTGDNATNINRLFDWAETNYPQFFAPAGQSSFEYAGYIVRYYSDTNNYVGIKDGQVYVYGNIFGGLKDVGSFESLLKRVE